MLYEEAFQKDSRNYNQVKDEVHPLAKFYEGESRVENVPFHKNSDFELFPKKSRNDRQHVDKKCTCRYELNILICCEFHMHF